MTRVIAALAPLADIAAITCVALVPLMAIHISDAEAQAQAKQSRLEVKIAKQREAILWHEEFLVNCLSGRTMVVGRVAGVRCIPL